MKTPLLIMTLSLGAVSCMPSNNVQESSEGKVSRSYSLTSGTSSSALYRAVNLNGSRLSSNGITFESSQEAQNMVIQGKSFSRYDVPLSPSTDSNLSSVIRSSVWGFTGQLNVKMLEVPSGEYDVYLYVWEDNNSEVFSVLLNGSVVQKDYVSGSAGSWRKLGPYRKLISNGVIHLSSSGGAANFSAVEVHKVAQVVSSPEPSTNNMISNAGFESSLNGWTNLGNTIRVSSPVNSGSGSARVGTGSGGLLQYINLAPNSVYEFSGSARVGTAGEVGSYGVTFKDSTGKEITNFQMKVTETSFTKKTIGFTTPASFAKAEVWMYKAGGSSYMYVDDLQIGQTADAARPVEGLCEGMGSITHEHWSGVSGTAISNIPLTKTPSSVKTITSLEIKNLGDTYGTRISGYICPPISGNYTFLISGDDDTKLSLSSSDSASNLSQIAGFSGWTNLHELTKYSGQKSRTIALTAGRKYFIEVLHKEHDGGDHVSVGWIMPDGKQELPLPSSRIAPKSTSTVPTPIETADSCQSEGKITLEKFNNITTTNPLDLNGRTASSISHPTIAEAPSNIGDNYGHRMSGFICVPTTGDYTFYVAGDDQVALFLSPDEDPAKKVKIAYHDFWTNPREYTKYPSQTSGLRRLEAGKKYYIEALQVEQGGGDNLSIGWRLPNGSLERPIPGSRLSSNPKPGSNTGGGTSTPISNVDPSKTDSFDQNSVTYSGPLVITKGGTYSGRWQSTNSEIPAIEVKTSEPVIIENCVIRGAGYLVKTWYVHADLTIRNCRGYGLTPTPWNTYKKARRFLTAAIFKNIVVENNYMESTAGIIFGDAHVPTSPSHGVRIRYNKAKNIDGRVHGGRDLVQFVQFNLGGKSVSNVDISYNQVINEPGKSLVEDNINIFNTRGTSSSPMLIHHNYIEGAYPLPGSGGYTGGGIISDTNSDTSDTATAYLDIRYNQVVSTMNYSFGIASGNNIKIVGNRAITSEFLPDGRRALDVFTNTSSNGYWISDYYKKGTVFNNLFQDNVVGVMNGGNRSDNYPNETYATVINYVKLPGPITLEMQNNEYKLFQDKIKAKGIVIGPK